MEVNMTVNASLPVENRRTIVFWIWKSLDYMPRVALSLVFVLAGFFMQFYWYSILPGIIPVFLGNLLLVVRGCDNRVDFGKYVPAAAWEKVDAAKITEIKTFHKKMRRWDLSIVDISNWLGGLIFVIVFSLLGIIFVAVFAEGDITWQIILLDAAVLLIPHWLTGKRSIQTVPDLLRKIKVIEKLLPDLQDRLQRHRLEYFMLLKGKDAKLPGDVKFRVGVHDRHPDFLGLYGQVVLNYVKSTPYPYFYVVLVARKGFGLHSYYKNYHAPSDITSEFKVEGDVEVFVIRQRTTRTSGYHTKKQNIRFIFLEGLAQAEKAAIKK